MKRFLISAVFAMLLASCDSGISHEPDGLQSDTIKLSADRVVFGAGGSVQEVSAKGTSWTIISFEENGSSFYAHPDAVGQDGYKGYSFEFENLEGAFCDPANPAVTLIRSEWFELRRELRLITVSVEPNGTGKQRSVVFTLEDRNYFGTLTVTQQAE